MSNGEVSNSMGENGNAGQTQTGILKGPATIRRAWGFLTLLSLVLCASLLGSIWLDLRAIDEKYKTLAREMGRSFFQAINTMREWNLDHNGIYVETGKDLAPNPYLAESLRIATTTDGRTLAMVNHSQMTRLLSELLTSERGIHLHISSLDPIRPANKPDDWERRALVRFLKGGQDESSIFGTGDGSVFRFIAPLR